MQLSPAVAQLDYETKLKFSPSDVIEVTHVELVAMHPVERKLVKFTRITPRLAPGAFFVIECIALIVDDKVLWVNNIVSESRENGKVIDRW